MHNALLTRTERQFTMYEIVQNSQRGFVMKKIMLTKILALASVAVLPTLATAQGMVPIAGDPVQTTGGALAGTTLASGVKAYLGIPYAAPPVGDLRWRAPKPYSWTGTWNADRKGAECMQVLRPHNINHYFGEEPSSENCLTMNIWTAAKAAEKLPVIVFIYGGGFTIGSSGMPNYGGEAMAQRGAIFVNFNYRVGALGLMAHPALSAEQGGHSGNYGIMDQTAALKWVHENIAKFGGDPEKVIIMGQSAGAASVVSQIFSPAAKGLFRGAVMSSACNFTGPYQTLAQAEQVGVAIQKKLGADSLDAMRQLPADRILAVQTETQVGASVSGVRINGPIVDGLSIPLNKAEALAAKSYNAVPIIAGSNGGDMDQGMSPITKATNTAEYEALVRKAYGANADEVLKLFPVKADADVAAAAKALASFGGMMGSNRGCAVQQSAHSDQPTFLYRYDRKHPYAPDAVIADQDIKTIGAYHTADIPYWFGTQDAYNSLRHTRDWQPWDRQLSGTMMDALIAFANTGAPGSKALNWPAWNNKTESYVTFGDAVAVNHLDGKKMDYLAAHSAAPNVPPAPNPLRPRD